MDLAEAADDNEASLLFSSTTLVKICKSMHMKVNYFPDCLDILRHLGDWQQENQWNKGQPSRKEASSVCPPPQKYAVRLIVAVHPTFISKDFIGWLLDYSGQ